MSKSKLFSYGFTLVAPFIAYLLKAPVLAAVTFIVAVVLITLSHLNKDEGHVGRVPSLADFLHQAVSTPLVEDDGEPRMGAIEEPHKPEETSCQDIQVEKLEHVEQEAESKPKPNLQYKFAYQGRQAAISVTNTGSIADVWASLQIDGPVQTVVPGSFAKWTHTSTFMTRMATGETHRLILAALKLKDFKAPVATWVIHYATDKTDGTTEALAGSLIGRDDGQAPDIHLYVKLFSDHNRVEPKRCHVVLHPNRAEELNP